MATEEGKGVGEGEDRGVLKLEREMKADFSPSPLLKKKNATQPCGLIQGNI